jgi:hypothetical protein
MAAKNSEDALVLKLIDEVKQRKAEIESIERPVYRTNCTFSYDDTTRTGNGSINLRTLSVRDLLSVAGFLMGRADYFVKAAIHMVLEDSPGFQWQGFSLADWLADIKTLANKSQLTSKRTNLEFLEKRLDSLVSPELRRKLELEAIQRELAS